MISKKLENDLIDNTYRELALVKQHLTFNPILIADVGANIGYYARILQKMFKSATIHSYEPQLDNLRYLYQHENSRLIIHPYGLFDSDCVMKIGMRNDNKKNTGTYGIYNTDDIVSVEFKNANNESIRPDFIKLDVEGSELHILNCNEFLSNAQAILVEMVYKDEFKQNELIEKRMYELNFNTKIKISKNDWLWLR